ncbi:VanW family protein [Bogoriella caseilytica]|uniref:Putative peptidoglycan binding protein n=1 Tax=Bogoriella caseilytica TaxID=56055 RepID=A0A3N2BA40_9MICO|nr:VanW family protein [Bogoriella caseilytica]ROR72143.1 putative peptidoglycan binding protein [Bogoriella caseilytica]
MSDESANPASPFEGFDGEEPRRRYRWVIPVVIVALLAAAYAGLAWWLSDRVASDATVAGVPIGGLSHDEAHQRLETELGAVTEQPISVRIDDVSATIDPGPAGLQFDAAATLEGLTGFSVDPRVLWDRLFGIGAVEPVTAVDEEALRAELELVNQDIERAPVEGFITFSGTTVVVTEPEDGLQLDLDGAAALVSADWLTEPHPLELPGQTLEPGIGEEAVQEARREYAEPLVAGPVTIEAGEQEAELSPATLAEAATFVPNGAGLRLELAADQLAEALVESNPDIETAGEDARIVLTSDGPEIEPATTGTGVDPELLAEGVREAITADRRRAVVELTEAEPEFSTADAEALGVNEEIVSFSTPIPYDPPRTANLRRGAELLSGTLVRPGEIFSLTETIGPFTLENGYVASGMVSGGFATEGIGGGLSQVSTQMFNVGYLAGMELVEHRAHTRWFDRYPRGREATVVAGSLDMRWRNNTEYGVMIEAWVNDEGMHTRLWSTPVWEVDDWISAERDITQPGTEYNPHPQCVAENPHYHGFTVDYGRTVTDRESGEVVLDEVRTHTYRPWHRVICGSPPSPGGGDSRNGDDGDSGGNDNNGDD